MPAGTTYDGQVRVVFSLAAPADPEAPTLAEINAGTDFSGYIPPDGVAYNIGNSRVAGADLKSSFDSQAPGRRQAAPTITFKRRLLDSGLQAAWTFFQRPGRHGTLYVFEEITEGSNPGLHDTCSVFTLVRAAAPMLHNTAENTEKRFVVDFMVGGDMYLDAVVGGS